MDMWVSKRVFVTYAYDGSGVALRARATVTDFNDEEREALIMLDGDNADAMDMLGLESVQNYSDLSEIDAPAKVASFGWLD